MRSFRRPARGSRTLEEGTVSGCAAGERREWEEGTYLRIRGRVDLGVLSCRVS